MKIMIYPSCWSDMQPLDHAAGNIEGYHKAVHQIYSKTCVKRPLKNILNY